MNTATILKRLLACTLLTTGCEFLDDIADTDGKDDSSEESGGDEDDSGDEGEDDEGDDGDGDGGSADESGDGEGDGAGDSEGDGAGDSEGEGDGADATDDAGAACEPDTLACLDELTIGVCVDGEVVALDCNDACIESGYVGTLGCYFDEVEGTDLCWCDDGSGGGEGGA